MNHLIIGRVLIIAGFLLGLTSLYPTVSHIGDPEFLLAGGDVLDHGYYHFFREVGGDVAAMMVIIYFLFTSSHNRTPATWLMCFIVALGYYAPYWIGMPFNDVLGAPHMSAEISHILQAALVFTGLWTARSIIQPQG
ncbi:MAG: hypothetical protein ACI909_002473 [Planctomycetota bacterium]|jgi:hypothetical protein|tara:strand:+ start:10983 stop:11393 length:411 start_codon:yes stop_codon:yes gene_type:complete